MKFATTYARQQSGGKLTKSPLLVTVGLLVVLYLSLQLLRGGKDVNSV